MPVTAQPNSKYVIENKNNKNTEDISESPAINGVGQVDTDVFDINPNGVGQLKPKYIIENNIIRNTAEVFDSPLTGVSQAILDAFDNNPHIVGQIDAATEEKRTLAEMKDRSIRCALWLKKEGFKQGDVLSVVSDHRLDDSIPCLAALFIGALFNPWVEVTTIDLAAEFLKTVSPKLIIVNGKELEKIEDAVKQANVDTKIVAFDENSTVPCWENYLAEVTAEEIQSFRPLDVSNKMEQGAAIMFSSGTTGISKSVELSYGTLMIHLQKSAYFSSRNYIALWYSPQSWITGLYMTLFTIINSGTRIIHKKFDVEETCKYVDKYQINQLFLTPSNLACLSRARVSERHSLSSVQFVTTGGSKLSYSVIKALEAEFPHIAITDNYGSTEVGGVIASDIGRKKADNSVGFIGQSVQLKVVDVKTGTTVGPNQPGELYVKKSFMMNGYYKNPDLTRKMIDEEGWYHTGDVGYYNEEGEIFLTDRIRDVIITRNIHISPSEIKNIFMQNPKITDAAVVGVPHEIEIEHPVAFVTTVPGAKVTKEELLQMLDSKESHYKLLKDVIFIEEMPRTSNGKIMKNDLKKLYTQLRKYRGDLINENIS